MPCADNAFAKNAGKQAVVKATHQQDNGFKDACSPFCQCSCCAGFSINHFVPPVFIAPVFSDNPKSSFLSSEVIEVALPIWQPPQLV